MADIEITRTHNTRTHSLSLTYTLYLTLSLIHSLTLCTINSIFAGVFGVVLVTPTVYQTVRATCLKPKVRPVTLVRRFSDDGQDEEMMKEKEGEVPNAGNALPPRSVGTGAHSDDDMESRDSDLE